MAHVLYLKQHHFSYNFMVHFVTKSFLWHSIMLLSLSNELLILPYIVINVANRLNVIDSMKAVAENIYHCIQKPYGF